MLTHSEAAQISIHVITLVLCRHRTHVSSYAPSSVWKNFAVSISKTTLLFSFKLLFAMILSEKNPKQQQQQ